MTSLDSGMRNADDATGDATGDAAEMRASTGSVMRVDTGSWSGDATCGARELFAGNFGATFDLSGKLSGDIAGKQEFLAFLDLTGFCTFGLDTFVLETFGTILIGTEISLSSEHLVTLLISQ